METEPSGASRYGRGVPMSSMGWASTFALGLITFILGAIITARPVQTLTAVAVLLGVVMVISGIYQIVRALAGHESERVWRGISGVLFLLAGLVLFRHLHLSVALIGLFVGFAWIIQGVAVLMEGATGRGRAQTGWSAFFAIISLVAGIIVISAPIASIGALTVFVGIWFMVMGVVEMVGSLVARRALKDLAAGRAHVPGQRPGAADGPAGSRDAAPQAATRDPGPDGRG
jgi:uncharacterized membrane protein HdeD (DUF308 family)